MPLPQQQFYSMKFYAKDLNLNQPKVLFETSHYCVVYKPCGFVVPIEESHKLNLERWVKEYYQKKLDKETVYLRPIHRIDKVVSGLVIFARSSKGLSRLQNAQREKLFKKYYSAILENPIKPTCGKLKDKLIHGDYKAFIDPNGKESFLRYRTLSYNVISIYLLTGRYHQIRAQFSHKKSPILGDHKYGSKKDYKKDGIALVHTKIIFPDPITKKMQMYSLRIDFKER